MYVNLEMTQLCLWAGYYETVYIQRRATTFPIGYEDEKAGFFANI